MCVLFLLRSLVLVDVLKGRYESNLLVYTFTRKEQKHIQFSEYDAIDDLAGRLCVMDQ